MPPENTNKMKRKRVVLTIETKLKIVKRLQKGESVSKLSKEYNIGNQTVRDILNNKNKLMNFVFSCDSLDATSKRKTIKKSTYHELDKAMFEWFQQQQAEGIPISGPVLIEKAQWFHKELGLAGPFQASQGWLTRFKTRHGIRHLEMQSDSLIREFSPVELYQMEFMKLIQSHNLSLEQIYNADETGLFWKALPSKSDKTPFGFKSNKERISLLPCFNANGTHKLKLACVSCSKRPKFFQGKKIYYLPVDYYHQSESWMTPEIFKRWFFENFVPSVREFLHSKGLPEKAMLVLDKSSLHANEDELRSDDGQIFVTYLPTDITTVVQPMDQGIFEILKYHYRKNFLCTLLEEERDVKKFYKNWTIADAIFAVCKSWDQIQLTSLKHSWQKLFPQEMNDNINQNETLCINDRLDISDFLQLILNSNNFQNIDVNDVREWLNVDNDQPECVLDTSLKDNTNILGSISPNQNQLSTEVKSEAENDSENELIIPNVDIGETDDLIILNKITAREALNCANTLLLFLEQQEETKYSDVLNIQKVQTFIRKKIHQETS
ncbi:jerky protein homolog-like [Centruroides sculpturatus]|uniref:jerky protein homolog-like n=1 Tax=Centruroides sculpturatus TaxID=218467 RepID=UPI000C6DAC06|nr:jerky protein homolog-like [Centruroides sculpturatus]